MIIKEIRDNAGKGRRQAAQRKATQEAQREAEKGARTICKILGGKRSRSSSTNNSKLHNRRSFLRTLQYVGRIDRENTQQAELIYSQSLPLLEPEMILAAMETTAAMAERVRNPCKHYVISWADGEKPTRQQMEHAAEKFLSAAGYGEHQAAAYLHTDNGKHHLHIIANHVHPLTYKAVNRDFRRGKANYRIQDKVARSLEIEHGLQRVEGKFYKSVGDRVVTNDVIKHQQRIGNKAFVAERQSGVISFERWGREDAQLQADIKQVVKQQSVSWSDIHLMLAKHNLAIKPDKFGKGLVITDIDQPDIYHVKASAISRQLSAGFLKKLFSADYQPPAKNITITQPVASYKIHLNGVKPQSSVYDYYNQLHAIYQAATAKDTKPNNNIIHNIIELDKHITARHDCTESIINDEHKAALRALFSRPENLRFLLDENNLAGASSNTIVIIKEFKNEYNRARGNYKSYLEESQHLHLEALYELQRLNSIKPDVMQPVQPTTEGSIVFLTVGELRTKLREEKAAGGPKAFDAQVELGKLRGLPDSHPAPLLPDGSVDSSVAKNHRKTLKLELTNEKTKGMTLSL